MAALQTVTTGQVQYAGIVPISPDGAIQQIQWMGSTDAGCVTIASRNCEFSTVVQAWKERAANVALRDIVRSKGGVVNPKQPKVPGRTR